MDLHSWFSSSDPVPIVAAADLRSIWAMQRRAANPSGQPTATSIRLYEHVCSPGADVQAVMYRVSMLRMLAGPLALLTPWLRDGELADTVFEVAATFSMKRMPVGLPQPELPFDVQGFLAEIEKQNNE